MLDGRRKRGRGRRRGVCRVKARSLPVRVAGRRGGEKIRRLGSPPPARHAAAGATALPCGTALRPRQALVRQFPSHYSSAVHANKRVETDREMQSTSAADASCAERECPVCGAIVSALLTCGRCRRRKYCAFCAIRRHVAAKFPVPRQYTELLHLFLYILPFRTRRQHRVSAPRLARSQGHVQAERSQLV